MYKNYVMTYEAYLNPKYLIKMSSRKCSPCS